MIGMKRLSRAQTWEKICKLKPEFLKCVAESTSNSDLTAEEVGKAVVETYKETSSRIHAHVDGYSRVNIDGFGLTELNRAILKCVMEPIPLKVAPSA